MKMYRTLGMVEREGPPNTMRWALEADDPTATDVVEVEVVKATRASVWVKTPSGIVERYRRSDGNYAYYDTEQMARGAIQGYINARMEWLERQARYCRRALFELHTTPVVKD